MPDDDDPRFRFDHHLVRDTVYNGLLKRARATMHVEFVKWADEVNAQSDRGREFEAILGYHLEQAYKYLGELGPYDEAGIAIGRDAARRLASAGRRAFGRGDMHAAASLLSRASQLIPEKEVQRVELLPECAEALMATGDFAQARAYLAEAQDLADRIGKPRIRAAGQLVELLRRMFSGESGTSDVQVLPAPGDLIPLLEREEAHNELALAWRLIMLSHIIAGRYTEANSIAEHSLHHARLSGNERLVAKVSGNLATTALLGRTPVLEAIAQCEQLVSQGLSDRLVEGTTLCTLAQLRAMNGELESARSLYRKSRAMLRDLEKGVTAAATGIDVLRVELLDGDLAMAERETRPDFDFLVRVGETYNLSTLAALLSWVVRDQGRDDDALSLSKVAEQASAPDDVDSQSVWRSIRAPIAARAGDNALAQSLAQEGLELARSSEAPWLQADALYEFAAVMEIGGQIDKAAELANEAHELYSLKGNLVSAARATHLVARLRRS
jgi:ATP/maltotriose-dependent transcriptional regulator MalT